MLSLRGLREHGFSVLADYIEKDMDKKQIKWDKDELQYMSSVIFEEPSKKEITLTCGIYNGWIIGPYNIKINIKDYNKYNTIYNILANNRENLSVKIL